MGGSLMKKEFEICRGILNYIEKKSGNSSLFFKIISKHLQDAMDEYRNNEVLINKDFKRLSSSDAIKNDNWNLEKRIASLSFDAVDNFCTDNGKIAFSFSVETLEGKKYLYVYNDGEIMHSYGRIGQMLFHKGQLTFSYEIDSGNYIFFEGEDYGPYKYVQLSRKIKNNLYDVLFKVGNRTVVNNFPAQQEIMSCGGNYESLDLLSSDIKSFVRKRRDYLYEKRLIRNKFFVSSATGYESTCYAIDCDDGFLATVAQQGRYDWLLIEEESTDKYVRVLLPTRLFCKENRPYRRLPRVVAMVGNKIFVLVQMGKSLSVWSKKI